LADKTRRRAAKHNLNLEHQLSICAQSIQVRCCAARVARRCCAPRALRALAARVAARFRRASRSTPNRSFFCGALARSAAHELSKSGARARARWRASVPFRRALCRIFFLFLFFIFALLAFLIFFSFLF